MADLTAHPLPALADKINAAHAQAEAALRAGLEHARTAGELLLRAKEQCGHGGWLPWLKANVRFSTRTAQAYMRVAREWDRLADKSATVAHLGFREALGMLAAPTDPAAAPAVEAHPLEKYRQSALRHLHVVTRLLAALGMLDDVREHVMALWDLLRNRPLPRHSDRL